MGKQKQLKVLTGQYVREVIVMNCDNPVKSESDQKTYKMIQLNSGLKILLISDPSPKPVDEEDDDYEESGDESNESGEEGSGESSSESSSNGSTTGESSSSSSDDEAEEGDEKLAAVGLLINAGSFYDPPKYQGLAHFLEHMIFMGSKKYPSENDFDKHIKRAGGFDNANTDCEETLFYFEVCEENMESCIKRFVALFEDPLLLKGSMTREREAIESEFVEVKQHDETRRDALIASVCGSPGHPSSCFGWGNNKSLKDDIEDDDELHRVLVAFQNKYYTPDRMYVCVQGRTSLEYLENMTAHYFSNIRRADENEEHIQRVKEDEIHFAQFSYKNAFIEDFTKKVYLVKSVSKTYKLEFTWSMPPVLEEFRVKPDHFISFLIGYESDGTLVAYLRRKIWALDIIVGVNSTGFDSNKFYSLFNICIDLTETGFNHIKEVIEATFAFLRMFQAYQKFETLYEELKDIEATSFRYQLQKPAYDNVQNLLINMKTYPAENVLNGAELYFEYDEEKINTFFKFLNEEHCNIMISSHQEYEDNVYDKTEKWFGTEYTTFDIPQEWKDVMKNPKSIPELYIQKPNIYISKDFTLFCNSNDEEVAPNSQYPQKIIDTNICELWFRQDCKFKLPYVAMNLYFKSPTSVKNTKNSMLTSMFSLITKYVVIEELYPAAVAGVDYDLYSVDLGLVLKVNGYNEKAHLVAEKLIDTMLRLHENITEEQFQSYVLLQRRSYHNTLIDPKRLNKEIRLSIVENTHFSLTDKYNLTWTVTLDDFKEFVQNFFSEYKLQALIQGNYTENLAITLTNKLLSQINGREISDPTVVELRTRKLPLGKNIVTVESLNKRDANTCVCNFYQIGQATLRTECILDLLKSLMDEKLFDTLRTKEQLGYDVSSSLRMNFAIVGYSITVNSQETKFTSTYIENRIERFRNSIVGLLRNMKNSEFDHNKRSLIKIKHLSDTALSEEVQRNWNEIVSEEYIFDRLKKEGDCLQTISKDEIINFILSNETENLRKLSIHCVGHKTANDSEEDSDVMEVSSEDDMVKEVFLNTISRDDDPSTITDIQEFKKKLYVYPKTKTIIDV